MCGLLGLLAPHTCPDLRAQLGLLTHRGPDDQGVYADGDLFLGARRLSVIDVPGGHQPLANERGEIWAAQNGEIYNHLALRAELERLGHTFRTRSDTEVVVHAYEQWGQEFVRRLRGIFALAVWDQPRRRLLLARDRFGVKPLYTLSRPEGLFFASEVAPLLEAVPEARQADPGSLRDLFATGFMPGPRTAFAGVRKIPPGRILLVEDGRLQPSAYWDLPQPVPFGGSFAEAVELFGQHLRRAVSEQRMSEVPLGALISGGLDSSSVAALLQAGSAEPLHTFNIGFERPAYDEARYAELTARRVGSRHHRLVFHDADFDLYPEVLARLEEPQASATAVPLYKLYRACREAGLTVILTGEGADELLGGYHWHQGDARLRPWLGLARPLRAALAGLSWSASEAGRRVLRAGTVEMAERYALWHSPAAPEDLLGEALRQAAGETAAWPQRFASALQAREPARQMQYIEARTRLPDFINFEVDRMSMAHSIEARVPFLDHELWEFVLSLPPSMLAEGRPKRLLRIAMKRDLPAAVLSRRKQGLAAPYAVWLRQPRLPDWAEQALSARALRDAGYFSPAAAARLRRAHQAGKPGLGRALMAVLSTQLWHAHFIAPA